MSRFARRMQRAAMGLVENNGPSGDYGTPGNRPALNTKPTAATTGPAFNPTTILSSAQVWTAFDSIAPGPDGFKVLSGAHIYGGVWLTGAETSRYRFEDCIIDAYDQGHTTEAYAAIRAWWSDSEPAPQFGTNYVEFIRCEIVNGANASVLGGYVRLIACDMHGGYDIVQQHRVLEVYGCYLHDNYYASGDHSDSFQVLNGTGSSSSVRSWFHYNNVQAFSGDESPVAGLPINRCVQTGSLMYGSVHITFKGNWFNGGAPFTVDGSNPTGGDYVVDYIFRDNKFGNTIQTALYPGTTSNSDFDQSNVWESNGQPVAS